MPDQASTRPCCYWASKLEPHIITFANPRRKEIAFDALIGSAYRLELFEKFYHDFCTSKVVYNARPARTPSHTSALALAYFRVTDRSEGTRNLTKWTAASGESCIKNKTNTRSSITPNKSDKKSLIQQIFTSPIFSNLVNGGEDNPLVTPVVPDDDFESTTSSMWDDHEATQANDLHKEDHDTVKDHNTTCCSLFDSNTLVIDLSGPGVMALMQWNKYHPDPRASYVKLVKDSIVWTFGQSWVQNNARNDSKSILESMIRYTKHFHTMQYAMDTELQSTLTCLEAVVRKQTVQGLSVGQLTTFLELPVAALIARAGTFAIADYGNIWAELIQAVDSERYSTGAAASLANPAAVKDLKLMVLARPASGLAEAMIDYMALSLRRGLLAGQDIFDHTQAALLQIFAMDQAIFIGPGIRAASPADVLLLWTRFFLQHHWHEDAKIASTSTCVSALVMLSFLYEHRTILKLVDSSFYISKLTASLKSKTVSVEWLKIHSVDRVASPTTQALSILGESGKEVHLLDFPWLFHNDLLILQFRNICQSVMYEAFIEVKLQGNMVKKDSDDKIGFKMLHGEELLRARKQAALDMYSVLAVSREAMLKDTFDQLWRRSQWELHKPLKALLGYDSGEQGADQGGPLVELFQRLVKEMVEEDLGIFRVDLANQMMSLVPRAWLPTWQIKIVGVIIGLAVYNNISIPVNFPLAFYRLLLGIQSSTPDHIKDGWPELAQSFETLLGWQDADLEEIFLREYVFESDNSIERIKVDMTKYKHLPQRADCDSVTAQSSTFLAEIPLCADAPLVTQSNKDQFVKDYIYWLTDASIRPELDALADGLFTVVPSKALSLFNPEQLKLLVEGTPVIDVTALRLASPQEYDELEQEKRQILDWFWEVAATLTQDELRKLLTFVTASDRVSPRGAQHMKFIVVIGGADDTQLPTAMTCFGYLTIPTYSSKEILEKRLKTALEHTIGFGSI